MKTIAFLVVVVIIIVAFASFMKKREPIRSTETNYSSEQKVKKTGQGSVTIKVEPQPAN